ncbi:MAG TPA: response regulator [Terriglobales bacterium]|nr:response regulator [Terriglobales bacterium]
MQLAKPIIMVVDDDDATLQTMVMLLRHFGFAVMSECDSAQALAVLKQHTEIAVLVCDFEMPGMNGEELARAAKSYRPTLPVFVFSGTHPPEASEAPWDAWFMKGAAINELIQKLQTFKQTTGDDDEAPRGTDASSAARRSGMLAVN